MADSKHIRIALVLTAALLLPAAAAAFDHLEITVMNPVIVDGHPAVSVQEDFDVLVRAVNGDGSTDTDADYVHAYLDSPDVTANLPAAGYLVNGERVFSDVSFLGDGQPVRLRAADLDDGSVPFAEVQINCYKFADHFVVSTPLGDKYVGDVVPVTVTARDEDNVAVRNFRDDVTLTPDFGHFTAGPSITLQGADFSFGVATVDVVFQGTEPGLNRNFVTAENTVLYPGQSSEPVGASEVSPLYPGPLDRVLLVMPGETLTPGVSPGKSGTPNAQISGIPFNGIDVYAVDQYWNPVLAGPYPSLSWSSDDGDPGVILPAGGAMASNAELDKSATLVTSGLRQVTVTASGPISGSSSSQFQVNPDGLDHFEFDYAVFDTLDVQATTTPFQVRVRAKDSFGNAFPYNGPVSLRVRIGGTDESADYLISSSNTFVNGQLNALMQVTKRAFSAQIIVDSNTGVVELSGSFQVNAGPMDRILVTFPGETWTPGLNDPGFSGNMGVPNDVTAGANVTPVVLRAVDRYGNLVAGSRVATLSCPNGYYYLMDMSSNLIPDGHVTVNGPTSVQMVFRTAGEQHLRVDVGGIEPSYSATVDVSPNYFSLICVVAPGETLDPGTFDIDGKLGEPSAQDAGVPFNVQVYLCDYYYNPISNTSPALPKDVEFTSSDPASTLPAGSQTMLSNASSFSVTLETLAIPNQQTVLVQEVAGPHFGTAVVPLVAGVLDHFDVGINSNTNADVGDALQPIPDHQAGSWLPDVTVIARDAFGNHISSFRDSVTLALDVGGDVITPVRVSLDDGFGSGVVNGVWRGQVRITRAGVDLRLVATDDVYGRTGQSEPFTVFAGPYASLQLRLPGEVPTPGESPGKYGIPLPATAGDTVSVSAAALDAWWNPVNDQPTVHLESSHHFQMVSPNNQTLEADGTSDFDLFFKTATTQRLSVWDLSDPAVIDSSDVVVEPGAFYRLQAVAPGETPDPGGPETDGKIGAPDPQIATLQFPLTVRAVDGYWNLVDVSSDRVRLISDEDSLGPNNPANNGQTLSHGEIVFPVALNSLGNVQLTALDETTPSIIGQDVLIQVEQGAQYEISVPPNAVAGPPATFAMDVALVDEFGAPMINAYNDVALRALTPTLQPAGGLLLVTDAALEEGAVSIAAQAYDHVQQIVIEVSDASGRLGYSPIIDVGSGGLAYEIEVDDDPTPTAGPPATFPVTVRLIDSSTGHQVDDDRFFDIEFLDEAGDPALGAAGTVEQRLIDGEFTFDQSYTRAENVRLRVSDDSGLEAQSGVFTVAPGPYARLQLLAPGETPEPGVAAHAASGKSGAVAPQRAGEVFTVTARAVDRYWNLADDVASGSVHLAASDDAFDWPDNPAVNDAPFSSGERDFDLFLAATGSVAVTVTDLDDAGLPGQTVHVPTEQPYVYEIETPAAAQTGGVPGFSMTVRLVDPDSGDLIADAFNRIHLTPYRADYSPGTGSLGLDEAWLVNGVAVINDQSYSALEDLVIRVHDDLGRSANSEVVHMETAGLYYEVVVPESATVGGPSAFSQSVELIDGNTGQRVTSRNSLVTIEVYAAGSGQPGDGVLGVIQQQVNAGYAVVPQTYTRAQEVYFRVNDGEGLTGVSNTCRMLPDGFKQLQIVAPGETADPGAPGGSGKTGEPLVQVASEPFTVEVRAVDQYWNPVTSLNAGALELDTDVAGALTWQNPGDYHAPFVNGVRQTGIVLGEAGNVTLYADDPQHPDANEGQVVIPVVEAAYAVTVPDTVYVGPPATFPVSVRLLNPGTGDPVPTGVSFSLEAVRPDLTPASGLLQVDAGALLLGEAEITNQAYGYSESLVIRISDQRGRTAVSNPFQVVPMGVTYAIDVPDTVIAGEPWAMTVSRVDVVTGRTVSGYDHDFELVAMNAANGDERPAPELSPGGVLGMTYGVTVDGEAALPGQTYDRAELIRLRVIDEEGGNVLSPPVLVRAARASEFDLRLEELTGGEVDRALRPQDRVRVRITARDAVGNLAPAAEVFLRVVDGDAGLGPTRAGELSLTTDASGEAEVEVRVDEYGNTDLLLEAGVDDLAVQQVAAPVAGPPVTVSAFDGVADDFRDGTYVSLDTRIRLSTSVSVPGMGASIYVDVDGADGPLPATAYEGPFTLLELGVAEPGEHELRFFAEEVSGVREALRAETLYTSQDVTLEQEITNRPNPFHAGEEDTRILFQPPSDGTVNITIYDLYGAVVRTHQMDVSAAGDAEYTWDGRNGKGLVVANGGYICRITGPGFDFRRKIAVVK